MAPRWRRRGCAVRVWRSHRQRATNSCCIWGRRTAAGGCANGAAGPLRSFNAMQVSCVAPPRYHLVQPGESLYAIAQSHGLSHTMSCSRLSLCTRPPHVAPLTVAAPRLLHRNPDIVNESHIVAGQVLALTGILPLSSFPYHSSNSLLLCCALADADTVTVQASRHALRLAYWTASAASLHPLSAPPAGGGSMTITGNFNIPAAFACHVVCLFGSARGRVSFPESAPFQSTTRY